MKRVTGIGGIFFKSENAQQLYEWYEKHLGINREPHGQAELHEQRCERVGQDVAEHNPTIAGRDG